jgi:tetratricopeptide (TPR) repeat protein
MQDIQKIIQESLQLEAAERFNDALQHINATRRKFVHNRAMAIRHGQLLERTKQFPQALQIYRQLAESQPQNQEAVLLIGLARCLLKLAQYEQAAKLFEQIQVKLPESPDVLTGLAACRRHKSALLDAEQFARKALSVNADFKPAVHELAEIQLANKDDNEAVATLERNVLRRDLYGDSIDLWLSTLRRQKR